MPDRGIVYVATRDLRFFCEAIASAEGVKRVLPDIPVTLFTDLVDGDRPVSPFDAVVTIPRHVHVAGGKPEEWAVGLYTKVACLARSAHRLTVFLDTDTRVLRREFLGIFDYLADHTLALVPCDPRHSVTCKLYGPMFNTGVMAYRRDELSARLFRDWEAMHRRHLEIAAATAPLHPPYLSHVDPAQRRFLLVADQTSLARLVSPGQNVYGMAVKALPTVWNARNRPLTRLEDVIVDHAHRHKLERQHVARFLRARRLDFAYDPARVALSAPRRRGYPWWDLRRIRSVRRTLAAAHGVFWRRTRPPSSAAPVNASTMEDNSHGMG